MLIYHSYFSPVPVDVVEVVAEEDGVLLPVAALDVQELLVRQLANIYVYFSVLFLVSFIYIFLGFSFSLVYFCLFHMFFLAISAPGSCTRGRRAPGTSGCR